MKSFESRLFRYKPTFQNKLIKRIIAIIRFGKRKEETIKGYKLYLFKLCGELVKKNIMNYEKLMSNLPKCPSELSRDELIAEAYMMLDLCIEKFKPNSSNSFYFYFNKSLSRNFYRRYKKYSAHTYIEVTDEMIVMSPHMKVRDEFDTMEVMFQSFQFTDFEIRIVKSRLIQQSMAEFCRLNTDVSKEEYKTAFDSIRVKMEPHLSEFRLLNEIEEEYE